MIPRRLPCPEARSLADERLDGALPPAEGEALAAHLAACPSCAEAVREGERLDGMLAADGLPDPGAGFTEAVVARLDWGPPRDPTGPARPAGSPAWRTAGSLLATGAVAAMAAVVLPLEEAAGAVETWAPGLSLAVPAVPAETASLLSGAAAALPSWTAAAGAAAAIVVGALALAVSRRPTTGER